MRMLTHDNIEQKDREKLKNKANINIGEVGNTSLRRSGLVSILATCRAWFGASLSEVVLRMVYGNVLVMIVCMTVSVQSP